jgi:hypothetical protein
LLRRSVIATAVAISAVTTSKNVPLLEEGGGCATRSCDDEKGSRTGTDPVAVVVITAGLMIGMGIGDGGGSA